MKRSIAAIGAAFFFAAPAVADMGHAGQEHAVPEMPMDHAGPVNEALSEGLVKKVDRDQNKLTIRHGPLKNLGMPGMTMVFKVRDPQWLDHVKPGDNIRFLADEANGVYTVTRLETVQ